MKSYSLVCVYCGVSTTGNENQEHLVPESLGCREVLYRGAVCNSCNNRLGTNVESKIFNNGMTSFSVVASGLEGKNGARKNINYKKTNIISTPGNINFSGTSGATTEFSDSRIWAKCAVNILVKQYGAKYVRAKYLDLVNYVREPKNSKDIWPFIVYHLVLDPREGVRCMLMTSVDSAKNEPEFAAVKWVGGICAIPLVRDSNVYIDSARDYIRYTYDDFIKRGGKSYITNYFEGGKIRNKQGRSD